MAVSYLSRTPSVAGNRKTFTLSLWVKRGILSANQLFFSCSAGSNANKNEVMFVGDQLRLETIISGSSSSVITQQVFRDAAAWYHIVIAVDTTQATAANRIKMYVNGVLVTAFSSATYPTQNFDMYYNSTNQHLIGAGNQFAGLVYSDLYMAEIYFVDGSALAASSFGLFDTTTGVWSPLDYSGSFGTNGYYLPFTNNTGLNTLGLDGSGNSNNWTLVATTNYNQSTDAPTNTSSSSANFCVWNPLSSSAPFAITDGNLSIPSTDNRAANGTFGVNSGSWYWEIQSTGTPSSYMGVTAYPYENDPDVAPTLNSANPRSVIGSSSYLGSMGIFKSYTGTTFAGLTTSITNPTGVYGFALQFNSPPSSPLTVDYLIVAGGGGGDAGGGGAGGLLSGSASLGLNSYSITVGDGGAGATNGSNSSFNNVTATGGGRGGNSSSVGNGGSGGGGYYGLRSDGLVFGPTNPGTGITGQGFAGGPYATPGRPGSGSYAVGAGGGGAGAVGGANDGSNNWTGGDGGVGFTWPINGVTYAGGGGGQGFDSGSGGEGGSGGGGRGQDAANVSPRISGAAGTPNTGGGGGGGGFAGGSGVVIISYIGATQIGAGGTVTSTGSGATTRWFHQFNSSGTFGIGPSSLQYYKDGVLIYTDYSIPAQGTTTLFPYISHTNSGTGGWATAQTNFGQFPWLFTPPTGYVGLNTFNLGTPAVVKPNVQMDATTYTGTGSLQTITNAGSFQPDFVWVKARTAPAWHILQDSNRGSGLILFSNTTDLEANKVGTQQIQFNNNGFSLIGASPGVNDINESGVNFVAWQWRASNAAAVTNTQGTITSQVSANTTAGFSVVTYTGTGANATVGHGLGITPSMVIVKQRNIIQSWCIWHSGIALSEVLFLNNNAAKTSYPTLFNSMATLNATVFSVGTDVGTNQSSGTYVAYCFAPIAGYSAFGSYTGNGSTDGTFIFTGFRPRYVMIKASSTGGAGYDWFIHDTARDTYNACTLDLEANLSLSENQYGAEQDFLSNGFKLRNTGGGTNQNGVTYIYMAFAENPIQYARAR